MDIPSSSMAVPILGVQVSPRDLSPSFSAVPTVTMTPQPQDWSPRLSAVPLASTQRRLETSPSAIGLTSQRASSMTVPIMSTNASTTIGSSVQPPAAGASITTAAGASITSAAGSSVAQSAGGSASLPVMQVAGGSASLPMMQAPSSITASSKTLAPTQCLTRSLSASGPVRHSSPPGCQTDSAPSRAGTPKGARNASTGLVGARRSVTHSTSSSQVGGQLFP